MVLYFRKKIFLIFQKFTLKKFLYLLIFWGMEFSSSNIKKKIIFYQKKAFLIFLEMETLKKFLIFQEVTSRARRTKNKNKTKNKKRSVKSF